MADESRDRCELPDFAADTCTSVVAATATTIVMTIGERELEFHWDACDQVWRHENITLKQEMPGDFRMAVTG